MKRQGSRQGSGKGLSRRAVLRGMGGAVIALPFLDAMVGTGRRARAAGGTEFPKRFVVWYTPNGTVPKNFWPKQGASGADTDFTLSPILKPLERHQSDLLVLGGIDMLSSLNGPGDAHQKGTGHCLTGIELQEGDFPGDAGQSAGWAGNASIDQHIAQHCGLDTVFQSLEFGAVTQGSSVRSRISYSGPGRPLPPEVDPYKMYTRLFGDPSVTPEELQRLNVRRQAVLDAVSEQHTQLRSRLGSDDRYKLDSHLEAVASIQSRLTKGTAQFGGACERPVLGEPIDTARVENMPAVGDLQMELLAMAFACDLTRVGSIMWSQSTAGHIYNWLGDDIREGHHSIAHKGDEDTVKVEQNTRINAWHAEQLGKFIDMLKAIPEGDGTVFDNTVIFWTNEQAKGNNHDRRGMPYLLAGSAGGYFRTGRYITQQSETGHNRLLVSLMNAMGVEGDEFGNPEYGRGPISGLT